MVELNVLNKEHNALFLLCRKLSIGEFYEKSFGI